MKSEDKLELEIPEVPIDEIAGSHEMTKSIDVLLIFSPTNQNGEITLTVAKSGSGREVFTLPDKKLD